MTNFEKWKQTLVKGDLLSSDGHALIYCFACPAKQFCDDKNGKRFSLAGKYDNRALCGKTFIEWAEQIFCEPRGE